jgi:UPF0716 protein FxsA
MGQLLLLFILVPAIELVLLIEVGSRIGTLATLGLIAITGLIGASLARQQGLRVLRQVQDEIAGGRVPTSSLVDGLIILVAGALLITPGILTDAFGFLCLIPACRGLMKSALRKRFERALREGRVQVQGFEDFEERFPPSGESRRPGPAVDVEYEVESETEPDKTP